MVTADYIRNMHSHDIKFTYFTLLYFMQPYIHYTLNEHTATHTKIGVLVFPNEMLVLSFLVL